jgi:hypothetical protein
MNPKYLYQSLVILMWVTSFLSAQTPDGKDIIFYQLMNVRGTSSTEAFIGSEYLFDEWFPAEMTLKSGAKANLNNVKINLRSSNVDAMFLGEEKELLAALFDEVILNTGGQQRKFYSHKAREIKGMTDPGFYEEIGKGKDKVIVRHSAYIQKPDPQAKILGLETRHKIVKRSHTFILKEDKLTEIKSKKDIKNLYKSKSSKLDEIFDNHKIDIKNPESLAYLIEQLENTL